MKKSSLVLAGIILVAVSQLSNAGITTNIIMTDNFNRIGDVSGSTTSDGNFTWSEAGGEGSASISNRLDFHKTNDRILIDDAAFELKNFALEFDYIYGQTYADNFWLGINYKIASPYTDILNAGHQDGYFLELKKTSATQIEVTLKKEAGADTSFTIISNGTFTVGGSWQSTNAVTVRVIDDSHQVYLNGTLVIDAIDSEWDSAGYWNFRGAEYRNRSIDNIYYSELIPPPKGTTVVIR